MSTAQRKARKRAGEPFVRVPKIGTPFEKRAWFAALIPGLDKKGLPVMRPRSDVKRHRALVDRGMIVNSDVA